MVAQKMNKKSQLLTALGIMMLFLIGGIILYAASYGLKALMLPVRVVTDQIDSAGSIVDKTYNPDNAIYNYEWFKTQYEKIQANRNQIKNFEGSITEFKITYGENSASWDSDTKQEYNRLSTIKTGLLNQDENLVAEYNARSKMANRNIFNDKLPWNVDKILR